MIISFAFVMEFKGLKKNETVRIVPPLMGMVQSYRHHDQVLHASSSCHIISVGIVVIPSLSLLLVALGDSSYSCYSCIITEIHQEANLQSRKE